MYVFIHTFKGYIYFILNFISRHRKVNKLQLHKLCSKKGTRWNIVPMLFPYIQFDGHESKPAISILAIVQESRKTSAFRYFSSYSF